MITYLLRLSSGTTLVAEFRTNTYEYPPSSQISAREVIRAKAEEWERELRSLSCGFLEEHTSPVVSSGRATNAIDVMILQGSPRATGNCSTIAGWARSAAELAGKTTEVMYLDDLTIHPCIGCYQCVNSGSCVFEDDMTGLIQAISLAPHVIICTPVYTNTIPGTLKIAIDRCQAYHASQVLSGKYDVKKDCYFRCRTAGERKFCLRYEYNPCVHETSSHKTLWKGTFRQS